MLSTYLAACSLLLFIYLPTACHSIYQTNNQLPCCLLSCLRILLSACDATLQSKYLTALKYIYTFRDTYLQAHMTTYSHTGETGRGSTGRPVCWARRADGQREAGETLNHTSKREREEVGGETERGMKD